MADIRQPYRTLIQSRQVEKKLDPSLLDGGLPTSAAKIKPHHCHRRLLAEYLNEAWGNLEICHL